MILHGVFGMLANWHNMARKLSEHINVITVDQRNHGNSPHSDEINYDLMAQDMAILLGELNISKAIICGHSMGGKTAMWFAHKYPEFVEKLIVVDIAPKQYKPGHLTYFKAFNELNFNSFASRKEADLAFSGYESNIAVRQFLLKNLNKAESGYSLKINVSAIEKFYEELIGPLHFETVIETETLFIYGGASNYVTPTDIESLKNQFSSVRFTEVPEAGHWIHAQKPQEFFDSVLQFLN